MNVFPLPVLIMGDVFAIVLILCTILGSAAASG
jgi:hypothetical protein